jgi:hypothetical protein
MQYADNTKDDISLRLMILKVGEWRRYLWKKKLLLVLGGILGAGLGLGLALIKKVNYVAELTFVLEESGKGGGLSSYAGIASQFGLDLGGGGSSVGVFSGDNVMEFLKSRLMIEKTLLSPAHAGAATPTLADVYAEQNELKKAWSKNATVGNYNFSPANKSRLQDSLLTILYERIVDKDLTITKPNKKLSFLEVKVVTPGEDFSKIFVERLVKEALDFYVATKTKRSKHSVDALQAKADSLERLLNGKTYSAAVSQDLNPNPVRNVARVGATVMNRDVSMLQLVYGEVIKNLEISKMTMSQETPVIEIVDGPVLPLKKEKASKLKFLIIGGLVGFVLMFLIVAVQRMYKDIMSNNE